MATTWYIDPTGGNDASAGTSFATRLKSFTGWSAKAPTSGDSVRVIASPAYTDTGQNATWTDGSKTVTLTTAVTSNISQATGAWSTNANASSTTSTTRKLGATSSSISATASFTTGLIAYFALGSSQNFSSYQQVSFWLYMSAGSMAADNDYQLCLCSDTAGSTVVNTINIPYIKATATWNCITVDTGGALGSAIQSIALYRTQNRGATTILLNNILACKASSSADSITLSSLISNRNTSTEGWWNIDSINGTTISLMQAFNQDLSTVQAQGYSGTTGTVELYKRESIVLPSSLVDSSITGTTFGNITKGGASGNPITFSGGWNTTDMSTQTGDTYIASYNGEGYALSIGASYVTFSNINFSKFYAGVNISGGPLNISFTADNLCGLTYGINTSSAFTNSTLSVNNIQQATIGIRNSNAGGFQSSVTVVNLNSNSSGGLTNQQTDLLASSPGTSTGNTYTITNCRRNGGNTTTVNSYGLSIGGSYSTYNLGKVEYNVSQNIIIGSITVSTLGNIINVTSAMTAPPSATGLASNIVFANGVNNIVNLSGITVSGTSYGVTCVSNGSNTINYGTISGTASAVQMYGNSTLLLNNTSSSGTVATFTVSTSQPELPTVYWQGYNASSTDNRIYYPTYRGNILTDTSTRHTASGISWKMTSNNAATVLGAATSTSPLSLPVATVACNASSLVTASIWVYRTSTSLTTNFVCPGGQIAGVSTTSASASAAINTWEQLTITFTPSVQGVVQLFVQCYGANASVYVDDFTVSQA
jgi:hypothetical protein